MLFNSGVRSNSSRKITWGEDIPAITNTSKSNEIRFKRDYKGKPFQGTLPVNKISENYFLKDRYTATFGKNILGNNVTCKVTDKQTIDMMMDWDKGQMVTVSGNNRRHTSWRHSIKRMSVQSQSCKEIAVAKSGPGRLLGRI